MAIRNSPDTMQPAYFCPLSGYAVTVTRPSTARIALNRPLRRLFDYRIPETMTVSPGQRVKVPFGRQTLTGLVVETGVTPPDGITLKPILEVLEPWLALPAATFQLLSWASDYYQHPPLGECLFTALPPALRRGRPSQQKQDEHWQAPKTSPPHCRPTPIDRKPCWKPSSAPPPAYRPANWLKPASTALRSKAFTIKALSN